MNSDPRIKESSLSNESSNILHYLLRSIWPKNAMVFSSVYIFWIERFQGKESFFENLRSIPTLSLCCKRLSPCFTFIVCNVIILSFGSLCSSFVFSFLFVIAQWFIYSAVSFLTMPLIATDSFALCSPDSGIISLVAISSFLKEVGIEKGKSGFNRPERKLNPL